MVDRTLEFIQQAYGFFVDEKGRNCMRMTPQAVSAWGRSSRKGIEESGPARLPAARPPVWSRVDQEAEAPLLGMTGLDIDIGGHEGFEAAASLPEGDALRSLVAGHAPDEWPAFRMRYSDSARRHD